MTIVQGGYSLESTREGVIEWLEHEAAMALNEIQVYEDGKILPYSIKITLEERTWQKN